MREMNGSRVAMKLIINSIYIFLLTSELVYGVGFNSELANKLDGTSSHINGPNCWNGALYVSGVVEEKKFTSPEEWKFILGKHCTEVATPKYGDIGRIYQRSGVEVHGFIHLGEKQIFAKHGEAVKDGYQYMSYKEMLKYYGRTKRCRETRDTSELCFNIIKYYSCETKTEKNLHVQNLAFLGEELVSSPLTKYKHKENCESDSFIEREKILDEMLIEIESADKVSTFLTEVDYLSLKSLLTQVSNIELQARIYRCNDRKRKKRLSKEVRNRLKDLTSSN